MPTKDVDLEFVRTRILKALSDAGSMTGSDIVRKLYPKAQIDGTDRDYSRVTRLLARMQATGQIRRDGPGRTAPFTVRAKAAAHAPAPVNNRRREAEPIIAVDNSVDGNFRGFLLRDIRDRLVRLNELVAELERLG